MYYCYLIMIPPNYFSYVITKKHNAFDGVEDWEKYSSLFFHNLFKAWKVLTL